MAGPLALGPQARTLSFERGGASAAAHVGGSAGGSSGIGNRLFWLQTQGSPFSETLRLPPQKRTINSTPPVPGSSGGFRVEWRMGFTGGEAALQSTVPTRIQSPQFSVALEPQVRSNRIFLEGQKGVLLCSM